MRSIQLIARVNQGGTARWLENLILGLRERGHDTCLLAGHVQSGESEDSIFLELNGIRVNRLGRKISIFSDFFSSVVAFLFHFFFGGFCLFFCCQSLLIVCFVRY